MDALLRTLAARLGPVEGEPQALDAGITNRNHRVRFAGRDHVVRCYGAGTDVLGIDRDAECAAARAAWVAGVGPEVTAFLPEEGCLVTAWVPGGAALDAKAVRADLGTVARALRLVHGAERLRPTFSPFRRGEDYRAVTVERGGVVPPEADAAAAVAARVEAALPAFEPVMCHNDLLPANLLGDGERLWIIDWEYAGMGDPFFDLGGLSAKNGLAVADDEELIAAYLGRSCTAGDLARLRLCRAAAQYWEGMWGVVQGMLSDLDFDFAGYARQWFAALLESDWEEWLDGAAA